MLIKQSMNINKFLSVKFRFVTKKFSCSRIYSYSNLRINSACHYYSQRQSTNFQIHIFNKIFIKPVHPQYYILSFLKSAAIAECCFNSLIFTCEHPLFVFIIRYLLCRLPVLNRYYFFINYI